MAKKLWYAIDLAAPADADLALAAVDDFGPTAAEDRHGTFRVFFESRDARERALEVLRARHYSSTAVDVDDEDWARRSQENLQPVTVGRIVVTPPGISRPAAADAGIQSPLLVTIQPSMGFGTGHHVTTRLCLTVLQHIDLADRTVLDIGTGSGVLAIAAALLGATRAIGVDVDPDAIQSATENLSLNPRADGVSFEVADFREASLAPADIVLANLTGALLSQSAERLLALTVPGGRLVLSGLLAEERDGVAQAFAACPLEWSREEDGWIGLALRAPGAGDLKKRQ